MSTHDGRRDLFAVALGHGATVEEAGREAGISRRTAERWARLPEVEAIVGRCREALLHRGLARLLSLLDAACSALKRVLDDPEAADTPKVRAASVVLDAALRYRDSTVLEERIRALETRAREIEGGESC